MEDAGRQRMRIAHASAVAELHPQTLRKYERAGLITPARRGLARHYTDADLERLALIKHLADVRRINVAGMALALTVRDELLAVLDALETLGPTEAASVIDARLRELLAAYWAE